MKRYSHLHTLHGAAAVSAAATSHFAASVVPALAAPRFVGTDAVARFVANSPSARGLAAYATARRGIRDLGRAPAGMPVKVGILLRYRHEDELVRLTRMQSDARSPYFHRYLSNRQWDNYFAPTRDSVAQAVAALRRNGFSITRVAPNNTLINATAPASAAERYFRTEIHRVTQVGAGLRYANVTQAAMPSELRTTAVAVTGLHSTDVARYPNRASAAAAARAGLLRHTLPVLRTGLRPAGGPTPPPNKPVVNTTPAPGPEPTLRANTTDIKTTSLAYGPAAIALNYDYPIMHGYDGTGTHSANVISGDFADGDIKGFMESFGEKWVRSSFHRVVVEGGLRYVTDLGSPDSGESGLDVQAIKGLAPGTDFTEYLIDTLADVAILDGYVRVVADNIVEDANSSFGGCESDDPSFVFSVNYVAMQGAAKGITFSASTGDSGSVGCNVVANGAPGQSPGVSAPAIAYYFVAVGGTDMFFDPVSKMRLQETAWETGGGGVSIIFPAPDWQVALLNMLPPTGPTPPNGATTGRNIPDVAMDASIETGYENYSGGNGTYANPAPNPDNPRLGTPGLTGAAGTSLSSPLFIALQSEINEAQGTLGNPHVPQSHGWATFRFYQIMTTAGSGYGFQFRDIIGGTNGQFPALVGYDNSTGIGAPMGFGLAGTE